MEYLKMLKYLLMGILIIGGYEALSQNLPKDTFIVAGSVILGKDTLPNINIKEVRVFPKRVFTSRKQQRRYDKLTYNVKRAYPFAVIAREELRIMNQNLETIESERARKKYIKDYEKEMFNRYEDDLKKLTFSQGRILLKLVYREIGNTSYNLVKEYRGDFSAAFWQGIARLFGSNLKSTYDPYGEDAEIEVIIQMIESGII